MLNVALVILSVLSQSPVVAADPPDPLAAEVEAREIAFARTMAERDLDAFLTVAAPLEDWRWGEAISP